MYCDLNWALEKKAIGNLGIGHEFEGAIKRWILSMVSIGEAVRDPWDANELTWNLFCAWGADGFEVFVSVQLEL